MRNALKSTADPSPHSNSTSVPWSTRTHIVLICCYRWSRASGPVHTWRQRCLFCHFFFLSPGVNSNIGNHATQLKSFTDDIKSLCRRRQVRTGSNIPSGPWNKSSETLVQRSGVRHVCKEWPPSDPPCLLNVNYNPVRNALKVLCNNKGYVPKQSFLMLNRGLNKYKKCMVKV